MKQIFSRILILICFLIAFSKSKTLENNITADQVKDIKQISLIEIKSEKAGYGRCGYNDWVDTPDYLGSRYIISTYLFLSQIISFFTTISLANHNIHVKAFQIFSGKY